MTHDKDLDEYGKYIVQSTSNSYVSYGKHSLKRQREELPVIRKILTFYATAFERKPELAIFNNLAYFKLITAFQVDCPKEPTQVSTRIGCAGSSGQSAGQAVHELTRHVVAREQRLEVQMRKIAWMLAFLTAMVAVKTVQAAPPCEWEVQKADMTTATLVEGDMAVIAVTTPACGTMQAPTGWDSRKTAVGACPGFGPDCCTWVSTKTVVMSDGGNATFTVEGAGCENNARTYSITVNAKPVIETPPPPPYTGVPWTQEEKDSVMATSTLAVMDIALGYRWVPNMSTMTRMGHGLDLQANGRIGKHASLGGGLWWLTYGQPIWTELRPTTMDTRVNAFSAHFSAAGIITGGDWLEWSLGGRLGASLYTHPEEYIGRGRYVAADTRFVPYIAPWTKLALFPSDAFGFYGQFDLQIDFVPRPTDAGTENIPETRAQTPDDKPHLWPAFGVGIEVRQ